MSDNKSTPARTSMTSLILPCAALALTAAAMAAGAPARLARLHLNPSALVAGLEFDASIRYEPVVSTEQGGFRLVGARRVLDQLATRHLIALR